MKDHILYGLDVKLKNRNDWDINYVAPGDTSPIKLLVMKEVLEGNSNVEKVRISIWKATFEDYLVDDDMYRLAE